MCHTGQVDCTNVPGTFNEYSGKTVPDGQVFARTGNNETVLGDEAGTALGPRVFCEWRYYNRTAFERMTAIGNNAASEFVSDALSGNTGDSARMLQWT
ncbi:hypothetical protein KUCAC02_007732 [Chaenocephalus aceratus]|uniref:Uncharacterized protein n=1 Tax=Chaenocephalus aceratus TaxID=36190 RepID=A0ACB9X6B7_CHAAC|nr:hypothetical protein KUCAC02_007732 [Chaenocephalus aceratus]